MKVVRFLPDGTGKLLGFCDDMPDRQLGESVQVREPYNTPFVPYGKPSPVEAAYRVSHFRVVAWGDRHHKELALEPTDEHQRLDWLPGWREPVISGSRTERWAGRGDNPFFPMGRSPLMGGIRISTSTLMTKRVAYPRSPARAKRRAAKGHPQHYADRPREDFIATDGGLHIICHPSMYRKLRAALQAQERGVKK